MATQPSRQKIMAALRQLINRPGDPSETVTYIEQTVAGFMGTGIGAGRGRNDRGAALLLSVNVENALIIAIERTLKLDPTHRYILFEEEHAPFQTFSAKITMAYAVNIINSEQRRNLKIIQLVRNVFAHASSPVTFSTPEIISGCSLLVIPKSTADADTNNTIETSGRERFAITCERMSSTLRYSPLATDK